jgi:hypothetical protein
MNTFIKKILLFVTLSALSYLIATFILVNTKLFYIVPNISMTTGGYSHSLQRFREVETVNKPDILFLGSSHCYRGFDPRIIKKKYSSFNLGNSAQTPYNSYYLAKEYLHKIKPKKVIFEGFWGPLSAPKSSIESGIDIISNKEATSNDYEMIFNQKNISSINSLMGIAVYRLNHPLKLEKQKSFPNDRYISGGFVEHLSNDNIKKLSEKKIAKHKVEYDPYQISYLVQLIKFCKSQRIEFEVVRSPVSMKTIQAVSNYNHITFQLDSICKVYDVKFKDFCNKESIEKMNLITTDDFYDLDHMSQTGVKKFNKFFLESN